MIVTEALFEFGNGTKFSIYHNLPQMQGLDIGSAFDNWIARTEVFTDKSFVKYIRSKNTGFFAYTKSEFMKKYKKGDNK